MLDIFVIFLARSNSYKGFFHFGCINGKLEQSLAMLTRQICKYICQTTLATVSLFTEMNIKQETLLTAKRASEVMTKTKLRQTNRNGGRFS